MSPKSKMKGCDAVTVMRGGAAVVDGVVVPVVEGVLLVCCPVVVMMGGAIVVVVGNGAVAGGNDGLTNVGSEPGYTVYPGGSGPPAGAAVAFEGT